MGETMAQTEQDFNPFDLGYFETTELRQFGFKSVGENVKIAKNCTIIGLSNISLGNNIRIDSNVIIAAYSGFLELGNYTFIGGGCYLGCAGGVNLLDFSTLAQGVRIFTGSDDYSGKYLTNSTIPQKYLGVKIAPVMLERHVIVGSGTVVLPGVTIGTGSSVGAMSLVTKSIDDWGIYCGSPVKRLKPRSKEILALEKELFTEISR